MWYAFQVKDAYNRISQYKEILELLKSDRYCKRVGEIFIAGNGKKENSICNYVFVKEDPACINKFWEKLSEEKYFITAMGYVPIPDDELLELKRDYEEKEKINVRYGDIVLVQNGPYRKLWGIVLRIDGNHYEVGLNFCEGPLVVNLKSENIKVVKSLFEIWKFRR